MTRYDWAVMFGWITFIVCYGLWRGRKSGTVKDYILAGKTMPWYAMGLSIMATQASAITFISTTGQAYVDGMRFVQFYFGLPVAMVILSATAVPIFHRANVYTAYEYLEKRFDAKTRALVSVLFLILRGLSAGIALYAPAVVLSVILGWSDRWTTMVMGALVVSFTATGGIKAVTWVDVQQMMMIFAALLLAFGMALYLMPPSVTFGDALALAGAVGRLKAVDLHFDPDNRYNLWSGLIGGSFLALAYFGCDQSQVQRYLTGKSIAQSRLSLIFNAMAKVPMQFFILFIGAMVFVLFLFVRPPLVFHPVEMQRLASNPAYEQVASQYNEAFEKRRLAAMKIIDARHAGAPVQTDELRAAEKDFEGVKQQGNKLVAQERGSAFNDTNYIFLNYVTTYLPVGVVGLVVAVIFTAAMSSTSGEINSLASVTVIDIYRRHIRREASDRHYVWASRAATVFWGIFAIVFANFSGGFGALIEAVNMIGSLFYPGLLGVFVLAFFFPRVGANGAFWGVLIGEAVIFAASKFTSIAFLWYNVIGAVVVVGTGMLWPRGSEKAEVSVPGSSEY
jgi:Na+/proline symporter